MPRVVSPCPGPGSAGMLNYRCTVGLVTLPPSRCAAFLHLAAADSATRQRLCAQPQAAPSSGRSPLPSGEPKGTLNPFTRAAAGTRFPPAAAFFVPSAHHLLHRIASAGGIIGKHVVSSL